MTGNNRLGEGRVSIRWKLLGAFLIAVVAAAALAAVALTATWSLGNLAQRLYDEPLQAISHARAAQTDFAILERADTAAERTSRWDELLSDLGVVEERVTSERLKELIGEIRMDLETWQTLAERSRTTGTPQTAEARSRVAGEIHQKLEILVEAAASGGFRFWLEAENLIDQTKTWTLAVIGGVVVLAVVGAALLYPACVSGGLLLELLEPRGGLGGKEVVQRRFNVSVPRARVPEKNIHASRALRGMIARPKISRNDRDRSL